MASKTDNYNVVIAAKDEFTNVITGARKSFDGFAKSIGLNSVQLAGALTAAAGAAIAFGKVVNDYAIKADEIGKMGLQIGESAESLSRYKIVADLSGVSMQTFTTALEKQNIALTRAKDGAGPAAAAIKEIGLSIEELEGLSPTQKFDKLSAALSNYGDASDRTRIANDLWTEAGTKLLRVVNQGPEALEAMKLKSDELGLSISDSSAAASAEFNDNLTILKANLEGITNQIAEKAIPVFNRLFRVMGGGGEKSQADLLREQLARNEAAIKTFQENIANVEQRSFLSRLSQSDEQYMKRHEALIKAQQRESDILRKQLDDIERIRAEGQKKQNRVIVEGFDAQAAVTQAGLEKLALLYTEHAKTLIDQQRIDAAIEAREAKDAADEKVRIAEEELKEQTRVDQQRIDWAIEKRELDEENNEAEWRLSQDRIKAAREEAQKKAEYAEMVAIAQESAAQRIGLAAQLGAGLTIAAQRAMEEQMLSLVETNDFSVSQLAVSFAKAAKMELISVAARSAILALFEVGKGLAASAVGSPAASLHFAAAGQFAAISGASLVAAKAVDVGLAATGAPDNAETRARRGGSSSAGGGFAGSNVSTFVGAEESESVKPQRPMQITVIIQNPLSDQNWDRAVEENLAPAIGRARARNINI